MKKIMLATVAAIALSGAAVAQTTTDSQLDTIVENILTKAGVEYDTSMMTTAQKTQIKSLADSDDTGLANDIYAILDIENNPNDPIANLDVAKSDIDQMKTLAGQTLMDAGITYDPNKLSAAQLTQIKFIAESGGADGDIDNDLYAVVGFDKQMISDPIGESVDLGEGVDQLKTLAYQTLSEAGIVYDVDYLSAAQLTQIKDVADSSDDSVGKESRLREIVGLQG